MRMWISKNNVIGYQQRRLTIWLAFFVFIFSYTVVPAQDAPMASVVYYKALKLYQKGNWDAAREYFHTYLAEYSDSPLYVTSLYYLGVCYQKINNPQEAMSIFHKVMNEAREGDDAFWAQMAEKRIEEMSASNLN